jgi:hypothetical protein
MKINPEKFSGNPIKRDSIEDTEDDKLTSPIEFPDWDVEEGIFG